MPNYKSIQRNVFSYSLTACYFRLITCQNSTQNSFSSRHTLNFTSVPSGNVLIILTLAHLSLWASFFPHTRLSLVIFSPKHLKLFSSLWKSVAEQQARITRMQLSFLKGATTLLKMRILRFPIWLRHQHIVGLPGYYLWLEMPYNPYRGQGAPSVKNPSYRQ